MLFYLYELSQIHSLAVSDKTVNGTGFDHQKRRIGKVSVFLNILDR